VGRPTDDHPDKSTVRVLGIDPGLVITGYGIVERDMSGLRLVEAGVIDSGSPENPLPVRLRSLYLDLDSLIAQHHPRAMALEQLYSHYEHPRTAILMGHARGVICLAAGMRDLPLHHYAATQVKSSLTGNGRASKEQMQQAVRRTFHLAAPPQPADVADAIAIALCHLRQAED
jgi:crossover junction endodeoxyribonuclease RuvC